MSPTLAAFSIDEVISLTGLTKSQLKYWDAEGFFSPEFKVDGRGVYSFRDLVELRTIAPIRKRLSLQAIRKIADGLHEMYDEPWSRLKFFFAGGELVYQAPGSFEMLSAKYPGQEVFTLDLEDVQKSTTAAIRRKSKESRLIGQVVRIKDVMRNAPVLAGTRVTTGAIFEFHEAGYGTEEILAEYPGITAEDVDAAIAWEMERAKKAI